MTIGFPLAFGLTMLTESAGLVFWAGLRGWPLRRSLLAGLIANGLVHPLFWFGFRWLPGGYPFNLWLAEGLVVAVEAALYRILLLPGGLSALGLSVGLNCLSFVAAAWLWPWLARTA